MGGVAGMNIYPVMVPGGTLGSDQMPILKQGTAPQSLVEYYERVFWPRWITLEQRKWQQMSQQEAALASQRLITADAQNQATFENRINDRVVDSNVQSLGVDEALCRFPSMRQSALAHGVMASVQENLEATISSRWIMGAAEDAAFGPMNENKLRLKARKEAGLCSKEGNAGADKVWCDQPKENRENEDMKPQRLIWPTSLFDKDSDLDNKLHGKYAQMFLGNLFPNRAFDPIREDLLNTLNEEEPDPAVVEAMADRGSYASQIMMFKQPFDRALGERQAVPNVAAFEALKKSLTRAGYSDDLIKQIFGKVDASDKSISKAVSEEIFYKISNLDPQLFVSDYAKAAGLNQASRDAYHFSKFVDMVVLLYDIREEIKTTNKLLGTLGSVMTAQRFDEIQNKTQGLATQ